MRRDATLPDLTAEITGCRACPRLVAWREEVARVRVARFADQSYWGRPVPGFGAPDARILIVGLAPAAHGGNRTGRVFTGDRSGDFLFASMYRTGLANQPTGTHVDDGLRLVDTYIAAVVRCAPPANKPTPEERDRCLPYLTREIGLLPWLRVIVALGAFAWDGAIRAVERLPGGTGVHAGRRPRFGHGAEATVGPFHLVGTYHPSQQNTFTGRLTAPMFDTVIQRAKALAAANASERSASRSLES